MAAPIAQIEDEWESFASFSPTRLNMCSTNVEQLEDVKNQNMSFGNSENLDSIDNFIPDPELLSYSSMEDLVQTFDEKLAACFRINASNNNKVQENPVKPFNAETITDDYIWKRLSDNYGLVQPLNWETSLVRKLHIPALDLPGEKATSNEKEVKAETEDPELEKQMDFHRMIEYNVYTEESGSVYQPPYGESNKMMQTADEVIEELEEIMHDADVANAVEDYEIQQETGIIFDKSSLEDGEFQEPFPASGLRPSIGSPSSQEESDRASVLKLLTLSELNDINADLEDQVKMLSADLLHELGRRDELNYENEVKNCFISRVLEVQYKQEQFRKVAAAPPKKFGRLRKSATTDSVSAGRYLTSVIPCSSGPTPTLENLQAMIKILDAIKSDSDEVPSLLTAYILKVLCPAPNGSRTLKL
uniref:fasciculation and elongation protein zeta-2-like n=1 Tax=Ciona intestinalis TaxID=7719 RepID=UPI000180C133|nr:fasciculation and elongation protein zeta-2-like [Ciona intestinalis]|eukprot:XP_002122589.1 fasciculation and elongation protein zeta-2-like [Ciona intestinalis]